MSLTRLLLLPSDPAEPAVCLTLDAQGAILSRETRAANALAAQTREPCVVAVPAAEVGLHRLRIRASSAAQAVAAAARLLEARLAVPYAAPHVAVSEPTDVDERWVGVVDPAQMRQWLDRAAHLGYVPTAMVPDCLLLAAPAAGRWRTCRNEATWRVRGAAAAFSAEPGLARAVLEAQGVADAAMDAATEADLARGALQALPAIDLMQQGFSRHPAAPTGWVAWRTAALLAGLVFVLVPLGHAAQALRHGWAVASIHARAESQLEAGADLPASTGTPFARAKAALAQARARDAFAMTTGALFEAIAQVPNAGVATLDFGEDGLLSASIDHDQSGDLERLTAALAQRGVSATLDTTQPAGARLRSVLLLGVAP